MPLFVVPKRVSLRLGNVQRDFLLCVCGGGELENKSHVVNWKLFAWRKKVRVLILGIYRLNEKCCGKDLNQGN